MSIQTALSSYLPHRGHPAINTHIRVNFLSKTDEGNSEILFLLSRHIREEDDPPLYISLHVFQDDGGPVSFVRPEYLTVRVSTVAQNRDRTILTRINRGYTKKAFIT